ncbi:MAG TPA: nuclear transport factor 2 family protein [Vitreimonas sp.]|nr:nuclear transport factor 2 family protein [Vitreimonas sp.]
MMRVAWLFAFLLTLTACATTPSGAPLSNRDAVMAASHAFDNAQLTKDRATLERMLANDYRIVFSSGRVGDRAAFLANFTDPTVEFSAIHVDDPYYQDLGRDAAIVGGVGTIEGTQNGAPFREHFMFADTFMRRDGQWVAIYTQVTPFAQPPAAAQ